MNYDFFGKVLSIFEKAGQSQRGAWKMWEVVIEHDTSGQYPRRVLVSVWDENVYNTLAQCQQYGTPVKATASVDAKEFQGRWYNDIRVWKAEPAASQQQQIGQPIPQGYQQPMPSGYAQQNLVNGYGQPVQQQQQFVAPASPQMPPYGANASGYAQGTGNASESIPDFMQSTPAPF